MSDECNCPDCVDGGFGQIGVTNLKEAIDKCEFHATTGLPMELEISVEGILHRAKVYVRRSKTLGSYDFEFIEGTLRKL